jgi:hypothetical protein
MFPNMNSKLYEIEIRKIISFYNNIKKENPKNLEINLGKDTRNLGKGTRSTEWIKKMW